jgi:GGDEF domain-containing protein
VQRSGHRAPALTALFRLWPCRLTAGLPARNKSCVSKLPNSASSHRQRLRPPDGELPLRVREIRTFHLSDAGNLACRQGLNDSSLTGEYFRRLKLINQADFLDLVNWQLTISRRYGPPKGSTMASVLGMKLENLSRVMEEAGEVMATTMLESLMERLQQVIRDTDRCMRGSEDVLWILLPQTPAQGLNRLQERLMEGLEQMNGSTEARITLRFVGCVLPDQASKEEDAALLLARLAGNLS